jgi:hypothetical protein
MTFSGFFLPGHKIEIIFAKNTFMKRIVIRFTALLPVAVVLFLLFSGSTGAGVKPAASKGQIVIPDTVMVIFEKACTGCHCDEGNGLAKGKLNFDKWGNLTPEKQLAKAQAICKTLKNKSMPPKKFRTNNPDLVPVQSETDRVCAWVATLQ